MSDYQLIVIGAGPAGYTAALRAAKLGIKTAVVESREVGGTCLNRGCIPTKTLLHTAELARETKEGETIGLEAGAVRVNLGTLYQRKDAVVAQLRGGIERLFQQKKIDLLRGTGTITASGTVAVEGKTYTADNILIATGSVPSRPPIPGLEHAVTSDELLSGQVGLPKALVIIGGGVIGMEFASFYSAMGVQVTVLEAMDRILPNMDREICQNLTMILKKQGVAVVTGAMVGGVERQEDGKLVVRYTCKEKPGEALGDTVLCAIGRRPNTAGLLGEGITLEMERGRIVTDASGQTSMPGVYAAGDVTARVQLAHVASAQGTACVERLAGRTPLTDLQTIPACVYTNPEIAAVGITADEAKAAGRAVKVGKYVTFSNGRSVIAGGQRGFIKVVADSATGVVLGAQLMCQRATDLISQFTAAVVNRLTVEQLLHTMRPHPTFDEGIGDALEDLLEKLGH